MTQDFRRGDRVEKSGAETIRRGAALRPRPG